MDVTTVEGVEESGERRGAEAAVMVSGKAGGGQRTERKESSVGGSRDREGGTENNQRSEEGALIEPARKGWGEEGRRENCMAVMAQKGGDAHKGM